MGDPGAPSAGPGPRRRGEIVIARILTTIVAALTFVGVVEVLAGWSQWRSPLPPVLVLLALAATVVRLVLVSRAADPAPTGGVEAGLQLLLLVAGATSETLAQPATVTVAIVNPGVNALVVCAYLAARTRRMWSLSVALAAAGLHVVALKQYPAAGIQGACLILATWGISVLVAAELRRAAADADVTFQQAQEAERAEVAARMHDTEGLLRAAGQPGFSREALARAVAATARRTDQWLAGPTQSGPRSATFAPLADELRAVVAASPDLPVTLDLDRLGVRLPGPHRLAVCRTVATALANVRDHAGAATVTVRGSSTGQSWTLSIVDDGVGFDPATVQIGHGLSRHSREALTPLGITMSVRSEPGRGTSVELGGVGRYRAQGGRFDAWHPRPVGGLARARWLTDLVQALLLASLWLMLVPGLTKLGSASRPAVVAALALVPASAMTVHWLLGERASRRAGEIIALVSVTVSLPLTMLTSHDGAGQAKLGIFLGTWSCMYLVTLRPDRPWLLAPLAAVHAVALAGTDLVAGLVSTLLAVVAIVESSRFVQTVREFGVESDADLARAASAERRTSALLLRPQLDSLRAAAAAVPPPSGGELDPRSVRRRGAAPDADVVDLVPAGCRDAVRAVLREVQEAVRADPEGTVDVRAWPGTGEGWRIAVLVDLPTGAPSGGEREAVTQVMLDALRARGVRCRLMVLTPSTTRIVMEPAT